MKGISFLLVGSGGAIGSMLRYAAASFIPAKSFPWPTLLVNIAGSFIIGMIAGWGIRSTEFSSGNLRLFLATGVCGGFTTFSSFSAENLKLLQEGRYMISLLYIGFSFISGIAAAWAGYKMFTL